MFSKKKELKDPSEMTDEELLGKKRVTPGRGVAEGVLGAGLGGALGHGTNTLLQYKMNGGSFKKLNLKALKEAAKDRDVVNSTKIGLGIGLPAAAISGYVAGKKLSKREDAIRAEALRRMKLGKEKEEKRK